MNLKLFCQKPNSSIVQYLEKKKTDNKKDTVDELNEADESDFNSEEDNFLETDSDEEKSAGCQSHRPRAGSALFKG